MECRPHKRYLSLLPVNGKIDVEIFRIFGAKCTFRKNRWVDKAKHTPLTVAEMRDPLPVEVAEVYMRVSKTSDFYVVMAVSMSTSTMNLSMPLRKPDTGHQVWEAVRYVAASVLAYKSALRAAKWLAVPDWDESPYHFPIVNPKSTIKNSL